MPNFVAVRDEASDTQPPAARAEGLGNVALKRLDYAEASEARARYEEAQPLYYQAGDVLGEARCIERLKGLSR